MSISGLNHDSVQQEIFECLHQEGTSHEKWHYFWGSIAVRFRRGNGVCVRFPVIGIRYLSVFLSNITDFIPLSPTHIWQRNSKNNYSFSETCTAISATESRVCAKRWNRRREQSFCSICARWISRVSWQGISERGCEACEYNRSASSDFGRLWRNIIEDTN